MEIRILIIGLLFCFLSCNTEEKIKNKKKIENDFEYVGEIFYKTNVQDSVSGWFIIDTGTPITVLDSTFVKNNNILLKKIREIEIGGSNISKTIIKSIYKNITIKFFNKIIYSPYVVVLNLKKLIPVEDGIIGLNFFQNKIIKIDYVNKSIIFISEIPKEYKKIPLVIKNDKLYIELSIQVTDNKTIKGLFLVDTGEPRFMSINKNSGDIYNIENEIDKKIEFSRKNGTVTGDTKSYYFKLSKCEFSAYVFNDVMCSLSLNRTSIDSTRIGSIGNKFLENFDVIFDIADSCLYLKPNDNYYKKHSYFRSGLSIGEGKENGYEIVGILEGSSAEINDIREGDIITKIDNTSVFKLGYFEMKKKLRTKGKYLCEFERNDSIFLKEIEVFDIMTIL